jgi:hypothetical protein
MVEAMSNTTRPTDHPKGPAMRTRAATATVSLLVTACLLAACGGGGDDAASADDGDDIATLGTSAETDPPASGTSPGGSEADGSEPSGSGPDGTVEEASDDPEEAMEQFAECMQEHGVDFPDPPVPGAEPVAVAITIEPGDEDNMQEAQEACGYLMEGVRNDIDLDPEEQAERQAEMLEFTECMRDQGVEMADPVFAEDGGVMINMSSDSAPEDQAAGPPVRDQEEFEAAAEECGGPGDGGVFSVNIEDE